MTRRTETNDESTSAPQQFGRRPFREQKTWKKVKSGTHPVNVILANDATMTAYFAILQVLKQHLIESGTIYFERDYRDDNIDPYSCYCFAFEHGILLLECDVVCSMQIHYDFTGYAKETEVLQLLKLLISLKSAFHKAQKPDLPTFFKGVIAYQGKQFIHTL